MVSLRRRRLMGLPNFIEKYWGRSSVTPDPHFSEAAQGNPIHASNSLSTHSMPLHEASQLQEERINTPDQESSEISEPSSAREQSSVPQSLSVIDKPVKHRKRYRRKQTLSQEPCSLRGVYFKNMKWQAAIKVEKKQIHLGTVGSKEEAARLYDRAAFMCGREPNFELPKEEKHELSRLSWDKFLAMTRQTIIDKKQKRRHVANSAPPIND